MLDARYSILDVGRIMDDLTPISRQNGGVIVGDARYHVSTYHSIQTYINAIKVVVHL